MNPRFIENNCKIPDPPTASRLCTLRPFVRQSGDSIRPQWEMGNRKLLDYLLVCINSGYGVFTLEDQIYNIRAGDLFWVPPDTMHSMRGDSEAMHCIYLHFDLLYDPARSHWDATIPAGVLDLSADRHLMHPPLEDAEINRWRGIIPLKFHRNRILETMRSICRLHRRNAVYSLELSGMMLSLLELIRLSASPSPENLPLREELNAAVIYLERRHGDPSLSILDIARHCGISHTHFRRMFHRHFGMAPLEYLRNFRNHRARELLMFTSLSVGEIAELAGFHDIYDFSRTFKQLNGISPLQFRRQPAAAN